MTFTYGQTYLAPTGLGALCPSYCNPPLLSYLEDYSWFTSTHQLCVGQYLQVAGTEVMQV